MVLSKSLPLETAVAAARDVLARPNLVSVPLTREYIRLLTTSAFGRCVLGLGESLGVSVSICTALAMKKITSTQAL